MRLDPPPGLTASLHTRPTGEYDDPWDTMSYANIYGTNTSNGYGITGPSLIAYHRDKMGWLPSHMIHTWVPVLRPRLAGRWLPA